MNFQNAVRALTSPITHELIAERMNCSLQSIRQATCEPGTKGSRKPPKDWEKTIIEMAMMRGDAMHELARLLQEQSK